MQLTNALKSRKPQPLLRVSLHDNIVSAVGTAFLGSLFLLAIIVLLYLCNRPQRTPDQSLSTTSSAIVLTLDANRGTAPIAEESADSVESPGESTAVDPSIHTLDVSVTELASADLAISDFEGLDSSDPLDDTDRTHSGKGDGEQQTGGLPGRPTDDPGFGRRWIVIHAGYGSVEDYSVMLEDLSIELVAVTVTGDHCRLRIHNGRPEVVTASDVTTGERLLLTWGEGTLREFDAVLFQQAGVTIDPSTIGQIFSSELTAEMSRLEETFEGRSRQEIRRTWYQISRAPSSARYRVTVSRQARW